MQILSDSLLLEKLREGHNTSFNILYDSIFPSVLTYIIKNSGSKEDAEDIFQEAVIVLLKKLKQIEFKLTSTLKTYLFAIARNLWLKRLRSNKLIQIEQPECISEAFEIELNPEKTIEDKLEMWIQKVTNHCQWIINALYILEQPLHDVMQAMGWKNKHTASNQKYKCIQMLKKEMLKEAI